MGRLFWIAAALGAAGCGSATGPGFVDARKDSLQTIAIEGADKLSWSSTEQLAAKATFASGRTADITYAVTWTSDAANVAPVTAGNITGLDGGTTTIHAAYENIEGTLDVTVTIPLLAVVSISSKGIDFFPANATSTVAPVRSIRGAQTTLQSPYNLAVSDTAIYVTDVQAKAIDVFDINANGDVAPIRRILATSAQPTITLPYGVSVTNSEVFVADSTAKVLVYPLNGDGAIAPTRTFSGPNMPSPWGLISLNNELYVSNYGNGSIAVFPLDSSGTVDASRVVMGNSTVLSGPYGLAIGNGELFSANAGRNQVVAQDLAASGNARPRRVLGGPTSMMSVPANVAIFENHLYVANNSSNSITSYSVTDSGDAGPQAIIAGLSSPIGMAVVRQ